MTDSSRRQFIKQTSLWAAAHTFLAGASTHAQAQNSDSAKLAPQTRFAKLQLKANRLDEMRRFYHKTLGCPLVDDCADSLALQFGETTIEFAETEQELSRVVYHFAFNIPENKLSAAIEWMRGKAPLIDHLATGSHIVHFEWLNAHSIYFWDPSGNLVEFIAHHRLDNASRGDFGPDDLLCASEIGLVVPDVGATNQELKDLLKIDCYGVNDAAVGEQRCKNAQFRAVGDPNGFFIVVRNQRTWLMTDIKAEENPPVHVVTNDDLAEPVTLKTANAVIS